MVTPPADLTGTAARKTKREGRDYSARDCDSDQNDEHDEDAARLWFLLLMLHSDHGVPVREREDKCNDQTNIRMTGIRSNSAEASARTLGAEVHRDEHCLVTASTPMDRRRKPRGDPVVDENLRYRAATR